MAPVGLAMLRSGLDRCSVVFLAWFGPRGLASIVFALLAIQALGEGTETRRAVAAVTLTVLMSDVLHGITPRTELLAPTPQPVHGDTMVSDDRVGTLRPTAAGHRVRWSGLGADLLTSTRRMGWSEPEHEHLTRPWARTECRR